MRDDTLDALLLQLTRTPQDMAVRDCISDRLGEIAHPAAGWWLTYCDGLLQRTHYGWRIGPYLILENRPKAVALDAALFPGALDLFDRLERVAFGDTAAQFDALLRRVFHTT